MAKAKIAIVGLGRMGTSIGLALKRSKVDLSIVGHDRDHNAAGAAAKAGAVDKTEWNLINACEGASLIILALPLNAIAPTLTALSKYLEPGQILTDTASTKVPVMEAARLLPTSIAFIGGHPVLAPRRPDHKRADRAKGEAAARKAAVAADAEGPSADLLVDATYCLVPGESAGEDAIQTVTGLVSLVGAKAYFVDAQEHDGLVAGVQDLARVQALALLKANVESPSWRDMSKLASSDFYRITEPVEGDPAALAESLLANREALQHWIEVAATALLQIRDHLAAGEAKDVEAMVRKLAEARAQWLSGNIEGGSALDTEEMRTSTMRLFLGGLARERKRP